MRVRSIRPAPGRVAGQPCPELVPPCVRPTDGTSRTGQTRITPNVACVMTCCGHEEPVEPGTVTELARNEMRPRLANLQSSSEGLPRLSLIAGGVAGKRPAALFQPSIRSLLPTTRRPNQARALRSHVRIPPSSAKTAKPRVVGGVVPAVVFLVQGSAQGERRPAGCLHPESAAARDGYRAPRMARRWCGAPPGGTRDREGRQGSARQ